MCHGARQRARGLVAWWLARPPWLRVVPALCWAGWIWWASSRPAGSGTAPLWLNLLTNGAHVVAFGALSALLVWALGDPAVRRRPVWMGPLWMGPLLAAAYGALDEWHQASVPGRVSSLSDFCSDVCGAVGAGVLLAWWHRGGPFPVGLVLVLLGASAGSVAWAVWG